MDRDFQNLERKQLADPQDPIALHRLSEARQRTQESAQATFGNYILLEKVLGTNGSVYQARRKGGFERIALKFCERPALDALDQMNQVFGTLQGLRHDHLIKVLDWGLVDDCAFVTMAWIEGRSLDEVLSSETIETSRALILMEKIARAAEVGHRGGLTIAKQSLRFQPPKILLDAQGKPHITSFVEFPPQRPSRLCPVGKTIGSPAYMSPEFLRGEASGRRPGTPSDQRSDVYSLAAMTYEILTGQRPFLGATFIDVARAVFRQDPPPPSSIRPSLGAEVDKVILHALAKDPDDRYPSAAAFAEDLRALRLGAPISAPQLSPLSATAQENPISTPDRGPWWRRFWKA